MIFNPVVAGQKSDLEFCSVTLRNTSRGSVSIYYFDGLASQVVTIPGLGTQTINCVKNTIIGTPQSISTTPSGGFNPITYSCGIVVADFKTNVTSGSN